MRKFGLNSDEFRQFNDLIVKANEEQLDSMIQTLELARYKRYKCYAVEVYNE